MSADTVDDLHAAEDMCGLLTSAIGQLLDAIREHKPTILRVDLDPLASAIEQADRLIEEWEDYCRPTCGFRDNDECGEDEETCGCPCCHIAARRPLEDRLRTRFDVQPTA